MSTVAEHDDLRAWPAQAAAPVAHEPTPLPDYPTVSTGDLASQAASALQDWGVSDDGEKVAASKTTLWKDPAAHPVALTMPLLDRYGAEYLEWDPVVLRLTLERDGTQLSNASWTKILAARVALHSPSPWRQWDVFSHVVNGLNGVQPNFTYLDAPDLGYLMHAIDVLRLIDPSRSFGVEINKFVAAALKHDGNVFAPASLSFCRRELENTQLECSHCKALHRDDGDTRCISCGSTALKPVPFEFEDLRKHCEEMWSTRAGLPLERAVDGLPQDAAGNLVYQLLVYWDYAKHMRQLLLRQLRALA